MRVYLSQKPTAKSLLFCMDRAEALCARALCARAVVLREGPLGSQGVNEPPDRFLVKC